MPMRFDPQTQQYEFVDNDPDSPEVGLKSRAKTESIKRDIHAHPYVRELLNLNEEEA